MKAHGSVIVVLPVFVAVKRIRLENITQTTRLVRPLLG